MPPVGIVNKWSKIQLANHSMYAACMFMHVVKCVATLCVCKVAIAVQQMLLTIANVQIYTWQLSIVLLHTVSGTAV